MSWIKRETAKSVDDLLTSQSVEGRDFPDFEVLDAKIVSALRQIISNQYFRRRIDVEEDKAQKDDRLFEGGRWLSMIYEDFRVTGAHDAAPDLSGIFSLSAVISWWSRQKL